jgi:hypothetical protein
LKKEENKAIIDDIKQKMEKAKKAVLDYDDIDVENDDGNELLDAADLIVENNLLIYKIDSLIGKQ